MADYSVDTLVTKMRRAGKIPQHESTGVAAALLEKLNDEQRLYLTRLLQSTREQYRQATYDITTTAGLQRYAIPARAVAAGVVSVAKIEASGSRTPLNFFADYRLHETNNPTAGDCYLEGNELVLYSDPGVITIRITYNRRLSELVLSTSARAITIISNKTVTIAAAPSTFTSRTTMDLVKATPHFDTYGIDLACSSIGSSATTITFTNTLPTSLAVGDYVCLPGETPVCNAPWELHDVLVHKAAYTWLAERGDNRAGSVAKVLWGEKDDGSDGMEAEALSLLTPRVETNSKPLINFNAPGWSRWRGRWRWPSS